jgi:ABC-2 type transport system ATP-binding protein
VLVASGLTKRYGAVAALDGCDLQAHPGRMLGFLGPNGAGKTTMMRAIFGLVALDAGTVRWCGQEVDRHARARFGYMPEQRGLYPRMQVRAQLAYLAQLRGLDRRDALDRSTRWLEELGLDDRADAALETLSHGNQQRVQLAASLVHDPDLLVLDEPFSGLDPLGVEAMERVLRTRADAGAAIVFSSHQLDLVQSICDDVIIIDRGRDILAGTLEELRARSRNRRVQLRFDDAVAWDVEQDLPGGAVLERTDHRLHLLVPRELSPEHVLDRARAQAEVVQYSYEPPSLSQLFREAVGR